MLCQPVRVTNLNELTVKVTVGLENVAQDKKIKDSSVIRMEETSVHIGCLMMGLKLFGINLQYLICSS